MQRKNFFSIKCKNNILTKYSGWEIFQKLISLEKEYENMKEKNEFDKISETEKKDLEGRLLELVRLKKSI